jgi:hypothetical protein
MTSRELSRNGPNLGQVLMIGSARWNWRVETDVPANYWYARGNRDGRVEVRPVDELPRKNFILVAKQLVHNR